MELLEAVACGLVDQDELKHYGRLGMHWYEHIYGEEDGRGKYMTKGLRKLSALDARATRLGAKADIKKWKAEKAEQKSMTAWSSHGEKKQRRKMYKNRKKSAKAQKKSGKATRKAERVANFMATEFDTLKYSDIEKYAKTTGRSAVTKFFNRNLDADTVASEVRIAKKYYLDVEDDRKKKQEE